MNLLFLNWRDLKNPRSGGAEVVTEEIMKRLVARGHTATLFTSAFPGAQPEEVVDGYTVIRRGREYTVHMWAFYYWFKRFRHERFTHIIDQIHGIPFFTPLFIGKRQKAKGKRYTPLSSSTGGLDFLRQPTDSTSPDSSLSPRTPRVVALIHEVAREIWLRMYPFPIGRIGYTLERFFFLPYRKTPFITVSRATCRDLETMGIPREHIDIIPEAITATPLDRAPKKDSVPTIIFVGRIAKMKGVHHLIEAYAIAKQRIPALRLWLVGGGDTYKAELEARYKDDPDITFFGFVDEETKLELLERATILASASMKEGYGLVVIEAAAMGTPSVVYNVDGFNEAVVDGKTGILTDTNPPALAASIVSLLSPLDFTTLDFGLWTNLDPSLSTNLYSLLQKQAHERSRDFNFDRTTDEFEKILTSDF